MSGRRFPGARFLLACSRIGRPRRHTSVGPGYARGPQLGVPTRSPSTVRAKCLRARNNAAQHPCTSNKVRRHPSTCPNGVGRRPRRPTAAVLLLRLTGRFGHITGLHKGVRSWNLRKECRALLVLAAARARLAAGIVRSRSSSPGTCPLPCFGQG